MYKQQQQYFNQANYINTSSQGLGGLGKIHQNNQITNSSVVNSNNFSSSSGQMNNGNQSNGITPNTYASNYQKKKTFIENSPHTPKYSPCRSNNGSSSNTNNGSSFLQNCSGINQNQFSNVVSQSNNYPQNYTSTTPRSSEKYNMNGVNSNFSGYISNYVANNHKNNIHSPYNTSTNTKHFSHIINDQDNLTPQNNISISNGSCSGSNQMYNSRNQASASGNRISGSQKKNQNQFEFIDVENIPQTQTMDLIDKFLKSSSAISGNNISAENSTPSERRKYANDLSPFKYSTNKVVGSNNSSSNVGGLSVIQQQLEIFKQTQFTSSQKNQNQGLSSQKNNISYNNSSSTNQSLVKQQQILQQGNGSGSSSSQSSSSSQNQQYQQSSLGQTHHSSSGRHSNAQPSTTSTSQSNSKVFHQTTTQNFREPLKNVNNINQQHQTQYQLSREDKVLQQSQNNNQIYQNQRNLTPTNSVKKQVSTAQQHYLHYQYSNTPQSSKNSYNLIRNGKSTNSNNIALHQQNINNISGSKNVMFGSTNNGINLQQQQQQSSQENPFAHLNNNKSDISLQGTNEGGAYSQLQMQSSNKFKQVQRVGGDNIQLNTNASNYSGEFGFTPVNMHKSTSKISTFNLDVSRDLSLMINNQYGHNASNNQIHNTSNNLFNLNFLDKDSSNIFNYHNDKDQSQFSYNFMDRDYSTNNNNNNTSKELSTFQTPLKGGKTQLSQMLDTSSNLDNITANNLTICSTTNNLTNINYISNYNNYNTQKSNNRVNNNNSYILEKSPNTTDQKSFTQQQQFKKGNLLLYDSPRFNNEGQEKEINENIAQSRLTEEQFQQPSSQANQNPVSCQSNSNTFHQMISDLTSHYNQKQNQLQQIKQNLDLSSKKYSNEEGVMFPHQNINKNNQEEDLVTKICASKNNSHVIPSNIQASPLTPVNTNIYNDLSGKKNQSSSSYTSIKKKNFYEEALQQADQSVKNVFKKFDILLKNKFETMQNSRKNVIASSEDKALNASSQNISINPAATNTSANKTEENTYTTPSIRNNSNTGTSRSTNNINQTNLSNTNSNIVNSYSYNTKTSAGQANPSSNLQNTGYIPTSTSAIAQIQKEREKTPPNNQTQADQQQIKPSQPITKATSSSSNEKKDPYPIQFHKSLEKFVFGKVLGLGSYAVVRVVQDQNTKEKFALKTYEKKKLQDPQKRKNVAREVKILSKIKHPNIVRLYDVIETSSQLHLLMEYPSSTPLNAHIKSKTSRKLCEEEAKVIFAQLVEAVKYCHRKSVVHRDIKLENVLYDAANQKVKLIDFGFSIALAPGTKLNIFCGTPSYMAPEIVNKKDYTFPVDTWALGILLFKALNGNFPFRGQDDRELYRRINSCKLEFQPHVSTQARNLISKILRNNPNERYTPEQILQDEWFKVKAPTAAASSNYNQN